jgi:hypothetical protein
MSYNGYLYAIGMGMDTPLAGLLNVQQMLYPYNRASVQDTPMQLGVVSDSVNIAPVRLQSLDAQESRDGITYLEWRMMLSTGAVKFWLEYFWAGAVASPTADISTAVTIYTRLTEFSSYQRYNCYAIYPSLPGGGNSDPDLQYLHKRGLWQLRQRFNDLIESS